MRAHAWLAYAVGAVLVVVWSAAFAWPAAIPAERAGLARPSWTSMCARDRRIAGAARRDDCRAGAGHEVGEPRQSGDDRDRHRGAARRLRRPARAPRRARPRMDRALGAASRARRAAAPRCRHSESPRRRARAHGASAGSARSHRSTCSCRPSTRRPRARCSVHFEDDLHRTRIRTASAARARTSTRCISHRRGRRR